MEFFGPSCGMLRPDSQSLSKRVHFLSQIESAPLTYKTEYLSAKFYRVMLGASFVLLRLGNKLSQNYKTLKNNMLEKTHFFKLLLVEN